MLNIFQIYNEMPELDQRQDGVRAPVNFGAWCLTAERYLYDIAFPGSPFRLFVRVRRVADLMDGGKQPLKFFLQSPFPLQNAYSSLFTFAINDPHSAAPFQNFGMCHRFLSWWCMFSVHWHLLPVPMHWTVSVSYLAFTPVTPVRSEIFISWMKIVV